MGVERDRQQIPDWARRERLGASQAPRDFEWIGENLDNFWPFARYACRELGRGAIVVDTTLQPAEEGGHPFGYLSGDDLAQFNDQDTTRMVMEYDPESEFVILLWKPDDRTSTYRIKPVTRSG